MQGLCVSDWKDYARNAGLNVRAAKADDEALSRVAVFRSMEACLQFAYTQRALLGVKVGEIKEYTGKEGGTLVLSTHEKKAQARFILDVIESHLSLDQRAMLDATYGGESGERAAAIEHLMRLCAGMSSNQHLVKLLLMREFIESKSLNLCQARIASECGVHPRTTSRVAAKIMHLIGELRDSTHEKLRPAFERRGWCPRDGEK
jgi:hypothetical protein